MTIEAHAFDGFRIGHPEDTLFGRLRWIGGFEVTVRGTAIGGLSGLVLLDGGRGLLTVSDDGRMLAATVVRDASGRPTGWTDGRIRALSDQRGDEIAGKMEADTESLDVAPGPDGPVAAVSFEGVPRVMTGPMTSDGFVGPLKPVGLPGPVGQLRFTKGLEALAFTPGGRGLVMIAERPPRGQDTGDRPGWVVEGGTITAFRLLDDGYDVTDAKFGPDGALYVLQRLFNLADGVRTRVRRVPAAELVDGAVVAGETIFEASLAEQIDNMEGLAISRDADGRTRIALLSDDNRSFLQRTVYLEFELVE